MPLDEFLPDYHVNEVHSTRVAAPPDVVLGAARALTSREVPLARALMGVRTLPGRLRGGRRPSVDAPILEQFVRGGFVVLAERPDELVLGAVGRFWQPSATLRPIGADEFAEFEEPGWAKTAFNFEARPADGGTELTTETRIHGTDEVARRSFRRYWLVIGPGSAAIRRAWLRAIRLRAERG